MSNPIIPWFRQLDVRLAKALPDWPVSLVMLIAILAGIGGSIILGFML